jgi:hypothetical protein
MARSLPDFTFGVISATVPTARSMLPPSASTVIGPPPL